MSEPEGGLEESGNEQARPLAESALYHVCVIQYPVVTMNREINILGTLAMSLSDDVRAATSKVAGMSGETAAAIVMLGANPGLTVGQVAHALALSPSGAVRLVDRLAEEGLVVRTHGQDQRTVTLELTESGMTMRLAALKERERILRKALTGLSEEEVAMLGQFIDRMLRNLMVKPDQDYRFCRMCDEDACSPHCPIEDRRCELEQPGHALAL